MKNVGLDYHKKFSYATMIDTQTGVVVQGRIENTQEGMKAFLGRGKDTRVVMESGRCWGWMYDMLTQLCGEVKLAHPNHVKMIAHARIKNDKIDSKVLAQLLCADLIPEAYARSLGNRQDLAVLRQRCFWMKIRTKIKNRIHELIDRQGEHVASQRPECSDLFGKAGMKWLKAVVLAPRERELLDEMLKGFEFVSERVAESDRQVEEMYNNDPVAKRLRSIPGLGVFYATLMSKEIDDINRFAAPEKLHSYAGLIPSTYASGGKVRHGKMTRSGNTWLRWAAVEAAIPARNSNFQIRALYDKHKYHKGNAKNAKVVVARRLLTIVFKVWKENRLFEDYKTHQGIKRIGSPSSFCNGA